MIIQAMLAIMLVDPYEVKLLTLTARGVARLPYCVTTMYMNACVYVRAMCGGCQ